MGTVFLHLSGQYLLSCKAVSLPDLVLNHELSGSPRRLFPSSQSILGLFRRLDYSILTFSVCTYLYHALRRDESYIMRIQARGYSSLGNSVLYMTRNLGVVSFRRIFDFLHFNIPGRKLISSQAINIFFVCVFGCMQLCTFLDCSLS